MSMQSCIVGVLVFLAITTACYARNLRTELAESRATARAIALRASNYEAQHDTTHDLARENARVARLFGDTLRAYARRAVQHQQVHDAIDSALGSQRVGEFSMNVAVDSFHTRVVAAREEPFHVRQEPFTIDALVRIGDSTKLDLRVALDSIPLRARIQCSPAGEDGIRNASVVATSPPWARVRFGDVQQDPAVCNTTSHRADEPKRLVSWAPVSLSVGKQLGAGRSGWSAQVGTALVFGARE